MLSDVVADQAKHFREARGLRRVDVADACARLGWPALTEGAIANLENGRRNADGVRRREVTADEIVVLATVLDVSPVQLLLPIGRAATVEITPGQHLPIGDALAWVSGAGPSSLAGTQFALSEAYTEALAPLLRLRAHQAALADALLALVDTLPTRPQDVRAQAQKDLASARETLATVRDLMRAAGDVLPELLPGILREAADA